MDLKQRHFLPPTDHFFLFGPRGTGKSTWLRACLPDAYIVDLLDDATWRQYLSDPDHIKAVVKANPEYTCFIIDEVQKAPKILGSIHALIEENKGHQFIMTGSGARKLRRGGVNLLGGRALLCHLHPFMASELGADFELSDALKNGLVPLITAATDPASKMAAYLRLYLNEEVQAEGLVREIDSFARFLETISFSHGAVMNVSNIARECRISRKSIDNYLSVLEDLLLAYSLPVFTKRAKRAVTTHHKFYLFDTGVFQHLRPKGPLDSVSEIDGIALEGLVMQHLKAWSEYSSGNVQCFFWRTKSGSEIDFILYGEGHFHAIEVKNAAHVNTKHLRTLKTFCLDYPEARPLFLYRGKDKLIIDGIPCWPTDEFLRKLVPNHWPVTHMRGQP